ncbi:MAG: hypothetical protein WBJ83_04915 [Thermacetogeniaceae bacterium]|jgi:uncharacterized protein (DUF342 family)|nr:DUF342 domain-containing protein [Syntrophomonadaceae bacterium]
MVKEGIVGQGKGNIKASGLVYARFLENANCDKSKTARSLGSAVRAKAANPGKFMIAGNSTPCLIGQDNRFATAWFCCTTVA